MLSVASRRLFRSFSGIAVAVAALVTLPQPAAAKTPGKTYCFIGVCHRVNTLQEMADLVGKDLTFKSSFYDDCKRDRFNPCGLTASGEVFRPDDADNAASPIYPEGTVVLVRNPLNGQSAVLRINSAGPYWKGRMLDVSRGTAEALGFKKRGVANLEVRVIAAPTKAEARYKKNRRYDAVPGPIGRYASLEAAVGPVMIAMNKVPANKTQASIRVASADQISQAAIGARDPSNPAEALRAEARRELGIGRSSTRVAPASLVAAVAPIHRSRSRYWVTAQ
jgi:rare lipoprotein A (peptidoglycan hydrolase)